MSVIIRDLDIDRPDNTPGEVKKVGGAVKRANAMRLHSSICKSEERCMIAQLFNIIKDMIALTATLATDLRFESNCQLV